MSEDLTANNTIAESNIIKISLMNFKNQSKTFDDNNLNDLLESIELTLSEKDILASVKSPEGSENLNPPEVMLIATEANSSFVVNGLIFDENQKNYLTVKVYEAKRGSMITSKKINLNTADDFDAVNKFFNQFKKKIY